MSNHVLSGAADADIENIIRSSIVSWGLPRTDRYISELRKAFETLAAFPHVGPDIGYLRAGYFQFPHDSHNVFHRKADDGIFVVRVLHGRQLPENYL